MRAIYLCLTLLLTSEWAVASPIELQRQHFKKTYHQVTGKKVQLREQDAKALSGYPLYPYLEYQILKQKLSQLDQAKLDKFTQQYADTPLPWQLNRAWLRHLFKNKQWKTYRSAYAKNPVNNDLYLCRLQIARLNSGARKDALSAAKSLWLKGHSQHKTCDPLFAAWKKTGQPSSALALQRFWLTVKAGNISLAKYIDRSVTLAAHKKQTQLFWSIRKHPQKISHLKPSQLSKTGYEVVSEYGYKRWSRRDKAAATSSWLKYRTQLAKTNKALVHALNRTLALRLAANYEESAEKLISQLDKNYEHTDVTEWRVRLALSNKSWARVRHYISKLPESIQKTGRWGYWDAIAASQLKTGLNTENVLKTISQERSFYGFLAAEINNQPFMLNKQSIAVQDSVLKKLESIPGLIRARELFYLGFNIDANREWSMVTRHLNQQQQLMSGYLALSWGWHNRAINAAIETKQWDELTIRFPSPHRALFDKHATKQDIDKTWPIAIARQESAFLENARSHAGARGLMQLMPGTAKLTAKKHKLPYRRLGQLNTPNINIALGTAYLSEMYQRFGHNKAYATAAYNAGPHRVKRWLGERGHLPLDIWIETIPFKETRRYVQNVLAFRVIYERLSGRAGNMLSEDEEKLLALNANDKKRKSL